MTDAPVSFDDVVARLKRLCGERGVSPRRVKAVGRHRWESICPAHDDHGPSMSLWPHAAFGATFYCHCGCPWQEIRRALGLPQLGRGAAGGPPAPRIPRTPPRDEPNPAPAYNFAHLAKMFAVDADAAVPLAADLGVSAESLVDARVGRTNGYMMFSHARGREVPVSAWCFPMVDAARKTTGLRLRFPRAAKGSWTGTVPGLFVGRRWNQPGPIFLVEGPTDRAAVYDWGFDCIARPSCNAGDELVMNFLLALWKTGPRRDVVILSNLDPAHRRPHDGSVFRPGQDGAEALARRIAWACPSLRLVTPPPGFKDARAWHNAGGTRADVEAVLAVRGRWRPAQPKRRSA